MEANQSCAFLHNQAPAASAQHAQCEGHAEGGGKAEKPWALSGASYIASAAPKLPPSKELMRNFATANHQ